MLVRLSKKRGIRADQINCWAIIKDDDALYYVTWDTDRENIKSDSFTSIIKANEYIDEVRMYVEKCLDVFDELGGFGKDSGPDSNGFED